MSSVEDRPPHRRESGKGASPRESVSHNYERTYKYFFSKLTNILVGYAHQSSPDFFIYMLLQRKLAISKQLRVGYPGIK